MPVRYEEGRGVKRAGLRRVIFGGFRFVRPFARALVTMSALLACGAEDAGTDPSTDAPTFSEPAPEDEGGLLPERPTSDAGTSTTEPDGGAPLQGILHEWVWIDVPGAVCGYGQPTGFLVNLGTGSDVLFYLEGGGLCWDEASCAANVQGTTVAHHFTSGYDKDTFLHQGEHTGLTNRAQPNNPFKDSTIIYVPYCTGDFHAGSTTRWFPLAKKTAHWAGRQNLDLFLAKIVPAFPDVSRVTLAGSSAGGYGTLINYWHVKEAFGNKRVDMISDSSPALWNNSVILGGLGAWNATAALPPNCPTCKDNLRNIYAYYDATYPEARLAFTTNDRDLGISLGGYLMTPYPQFYDAIRDLTFGTMKSFSNLKYFVADGTHHPLMDDLDVVSQPHCCTPVFGRCFFPQACGKAVNLGDWLTQMATDDPSWASQTAIAH